MKTTTLNPKDLLTKNKEADIKTSIDANARVNSDGYKYIRPSLSAVKDYKELCLHLDKPSLNKSEVLNYFCGSRKYIDLTDNEKSKLDSKTRPLLQVIDLLSFDSEFVKSELEAIKRTEENSLELLSMF